MKRVLFYRLGYFLFDKIFYDLANKPMLNFLKYNYNGNSLVGVEIGVRESNNAERMLNELKNLKMLYLIDPYKDYFDVESNVLERVNIFKGYSLDKLNRNHVGRFVFVYKTSDNAVNDIPDVLDFVYIDGNHAYDFVKRDIELFYPKVKFGGVFGGHDYNCKGVKCAVDNFVKKYGYKLFVCNQDWWIIKKEE